MHRPVIAAILSAVLLVSGCAARQVRIAELKNQPTNYENKSVRVVGTVTTSFRVPLVSFQVYNVDDGSGEISVVSRSGGTVTKGTRVEVKGRVTDIAAFAGQSLGLHLREEDRKILN
jgi:hypothetical protein